MKVAIYIENGVTQLVLTPEGDWEQKVCKEMAANGDHRVTIKRGSFYETQGGWYRMGYGDDSLILRVDRLEPQAEFGGDDKSFADFTERVMGGQP